MQQGPSLLLFVFMSCFRVVVFLEESDISKSFSIFVSSYLMSSTRCKLWFTPSWHVISKQFRARHFLWKKNNYQRITKNLSFKLNLLYGAFDPLKSISTDLLYRMFSVIQNIVLYDTEKVGINYEIKMLRITKKIRTLINFHSEGEENRK